MRFTGRHADEAPGDAVVDADGLVLAAAVAEPARGDAPQAGPAGQVEEDHCVGGRQADRQGGGVVPVDDPAGWGSQWFGLRVQAKRLKRLKSRRLGYDLGYKSGKQLDLLLRDAARSGLRAAYVLYNGPELNVSAFGGGCGRLPQVPETFGVTLLPASVAEDLVRHGHDDFTSVARVSRPWSCLAGCCWPECGRWGRYEDELPTRAGGDLSVWAASSYRYIEGARQADPERGGVPELGLRNRPPNYVTNLLGRGTAPATTDDVREDPRLPARVGAVTVFRAAG